MNWKSVKISKNALKWYPPGGLSGNPRIPPESRKALWALESLGLWPATLNAVFKALEPDSGYLRLFTLFQSVPAVLAILARVYGKPRYFRPF